MNCSSSSFRFSMSLQIKSLSGRIYLFFYTLILIIFTLRSLFTFIFPRSFVKFRQLINFVRFRKRSWIGFKLNFNHNFQSFIFCLGPARCVSKIVWIILLDILPKRITCVYVHGQTDHISWLLNNYSHDIESDYCPTIGTLDLFFIFLFLLYFFCAFVIQSLWLKL